LRKLLQRRHRSRQVETRQAEGELERNQDLLERVAAGIALNKTPGR
jgi:hypothetical protein